MDKKIDKETLEHKEFYEGFLKFTTYTAGIIILIVVQVFLYLFFYPLLNSLYFDLFIHLLT